MHPATFPACRSSGVKGLDTDLRLCLSNRQVDQDAVSWDWLSLNEQHGSAPVLIDIVGQRPLCEDFLDGAEAGDKLDPHWDTLSDALRHAPRLAPGMKRVSTLCRRVADGAGEQAKSALCVSAPWSRG